MTNLPQEGTSPDGMFGKPISEYSDEHALEDGVLIDLTQFTKLRFHRLPINRMTRHLFEAFGPELDNEEERKRFVITCGGCFGSSLVSPSLPQRALATSGGCLQTSGLF